jgi:S-adenosylmethionine/arginine decarboxylase-like enzyme
MSIVQIGYPSLGTHIIINLYDIFNTDLLRYLSYGKLTLFEIADSLKLNVINNFGHQIIPIGYTFTIIMLKSHMILHTNPENNSCYLDIFLCDKELNYKHFIEIIKNAFKTENITYYTIKR